MIKTCRSCDLKFEITPADRDFYAKIDVPEPGNCPRCRLIRRLQERNTRRLYYRKCDYSGEKIISQFHENLPFPVYKPDTWWSDKWDPLQYGRDFNFRRSFFDQFRELKQKVPHQGLYVISGTMENSDYTNCTGYLKNCYLIFESDYDEDCYYSNLLKNSRDLMDCSVCYDCERCYECIDCIDCYNLKYAQDCRNCQDSYFLKDCSGCKNCIGCINQKHKEFMVFNKQYTREHYEKMKRNFGLDSLQNVEKLRKKVEEFFITQFRRPLEEENNQNCVGDHLYNSKNSFECYDSKDLEDCKYCVKVSLGVKSAMDYNSWGDKAELVYETASSGDNIYNVKFCTTCTSHVSNCEYCYGCARCSDLFGCVSVKDKKYCILNKQYSQEDYLKLKGKIIAHMKKTGEYGEFFPNDLCPFGYNETIAMAYFPMNREEALKKGYGWVEKEPVVKRHEPVDKGPDKIGDAKDNIVRQILSCKTCGSYYRIILHELKFYRNMHIPVPDMCPDCRYEARMRMRPSLKLWDRKCDKCGSDMKSSFSPERPETIYCRSCYLKEVY